MPLAEQMGFRHRMQTRCTMSPTTPGPTRQRQRPGRRLVSIPTAAGYTLSAAPRLHMALRPMPTRCSSPNPWLGLSNAPDALPTLKQVANHREGTSSLPYSLHSVQIYEVRRRGSVSLSSVQRKAPQARDFVYDWPR